MFLLPMTTKRLRQKNVTLSLQTGFLAKIIKAITDAIVPEQTKFVLEIHTFGVKANGETVNNAIYRPLLEETGDGSAVFEGTIEYKMLNQRTLHDTETHKSITTIGDELVIILDKDYTGTDAPETTYNEDNASEDAPTNTGEVSVDAAIYSVADDVTITLTDLDLNTDSGAREIFDIVNSTGYTEMPPLVSIKIGRPGLQSRYKRYLATRDGRRQRRV